jgi:uncharacterized protein (TIGR02452 family)
VLGALGCGAFGNPIKQVNENILEEGFKGHFNEIIFAMLDTRTKWILRAFHKILDRLVVE